RLHDGWNVRLMRCALIPTQLSLTPATPGHGMGADWCWQRSTATMRRSTLSGGRWKLTHRMYGTGTIRAIRWWRLVISALRAKCWNGRRGWTRTTAKAGRSWGRRTDGLTDMPMRWQPTTVLWQ